MIVLKYIVVLIAGGVLAVGVSTFAYVKPTEAQESSGFMYTLDVDINQSAVDLNRELDMVQSAGADAIKIGAVWWYLSEAGPRDYDWSNLDRAVAGAEQRNMKVVFQLSGTPDWVHPRLKQSVPRFSQRIWHPPRGPAQLKRWRDFVYDVVDRYGARVAMYEMWNEPNIEAFWKPTPRPAEFVSLMRTSYLAAKRAHPNAKVVSGGLSRNDLGYLGKYYDIAAKHPDAAPNRYYFDTLGLHPYSSRYIRPGNLTEIPLPPGKTDPRARFSGAFGPMDWNYLGMKRMKNLMNQRGDVGKGIWIGEYGFPTKNTYMRAVSRAQRAAYLKRAYTLAEGLPYVEGMCWYTLRTDEPSERPFAIMGGGFNPSQTYVAFRQIAGGPRTLQ